MIENILIALMTRLASWLYAKALAKYNETEQKNSGDAQVDARLAAVKAAYNEAFNGQKVSPEQRKKLNQAIGDFLHGTGDGGL